MNKANAKSSVSVIVPVYNGAETLRRAVESALGQAETGQVILIDDASTDETKFIAQDLEAQHERVLLHSLDVNKGPAAARNTGLSFASCEWIALLDADDFFQENRLHNLLKHAQGQDIIADDLYIEGKDETLLNLSGSNARPISLKIYLESNLPRKGRARTELSFVKPLIRRSFLDQASGRYNENLRLGEDYDFYARLLVRGAKMVLLPAQGYVYRISNNSLSAQHSAKDLKNLRDCNAALLNNPRVGNTEKQLLKEIGTSVDCRYQWQRLINAVKAKNMSEALACFIRPWPVPRFLLGRLAYEFTRRALRRP